MAENVRVTVRCRPMNTRENTLKCQNIVKIDGCSLELENLADPSAPNKVFTFDGVYRPTDTTEQMYQDLCYSLVENVLEGYNGTIFAYGQTGCGKTHTMQGSEIVQPQGQRIGVVGEKNHFDNNHDGISQRGIIMRSFDHIFEAIALASGIRYLAMVSYLEIYNENIRDLLNPESSSNHQLKELPSMGGVVVPTLSTYTVHNAIECYKLLYTGNCNRMIGATLMNQTSSRSHTIFSIQLEQIIDNDDVNSHARDSAGSIRSGKLNLVDLAGSERQNKTGALGDRLKEATKINLSLSALGNVISALVDGKTKYIPYRDSKLTRILQDSLGGNTKTLMIACISPADNNYDETISTLRYASRAKNIANKPIINEDPKDAKLREYQEVIKNLKIMLSLSGAGGQTTMAVVNQPMNDETNSNVANQTTQPQPFQSSALISVPLQSIDDVETMVLNADTMQPNIIATNLPLSVGNSGGDEIGLQLEVQKRIEAIKRALIGGERANDLELRERRRKKKLEAQRRLNTLAYLLGRVKQNEDRDLLQDHYTNIQQEVNAKNECLKRCRQRIRSLECEVSDIQAEFQLDRADYLETIRRQERGVKFYRQLLDEALPILRKDGKYWDPDDILLHSVWNDDSKNWKLPSTLAKSLKLPRPTPLTNEAKAKQADAINDDLEQSDEIQLDQQYLDRRYKSDVLKNYFRSTRPKWNYNAENSNAMPRNELKTLKSIKF